MNHSKKKMIGNKIENAIQRNVTELVTLSDFDHGQFEDWDMNMTTIRHIPTVPREQVSVNNKQIIMLTRFAEQKRIDIAIQTVALLPDYKLNLYGSGS